MDIEEITKTTENMWVDIFIRDELSKICNLDGMTIEKKRAFAKGVLKGMAEAEREEKTDDN